MKKKILSLLLIGVVMFALTGCGLGSSKNSLGDKISTDIAEFTIENAKLTLAVDSEGNFKDYEEDENYEYVASKGHVFASLTFIIKNLDRNRLDFNDNFIKVKYNGKESSNLNIVSSSGDLAKWDTTTKISLDAGEELTYRGYLDVDIDAKNLEDNFEVVVELPKSDSSKVNYGFLVTKSARDNAKIREISLETAIDRYPLAATLEYFEKHLDEFDTLNGTQINELVESNNGDHYLKIGNSDYKHHEFTEKKSSGNNLIIWPGGTGTSSFMYDVGIWSVEGDTLKIKSSEYIVKKLNDSYYLLIYKSDNSIAGLMR